MARAQARLRAFANAIKAPDAQHAAGERERAARELGEAICDALKAAGDELAAQAFTAPETLEDWEHLARIVGIPFETIQSGKFTAADVYVMAVAWVDRQKIKAKLAGRKGTSSKAGKSTAYAVGALRDLIGLSNTTLNQYAKAAGVNTPRRGQRNFRYSTADVRAILQYIIDTTSESALRKRCRATLETLPEITD